MEQCRQAGIEVKMLPSAEQLLNGPNRLQIRDVNIADLLRREVVELDSSDIKRMVEGRRVLVTGAGGSIGSEICRQVIKCRPKEIVLIERAENNLFDIIQEVRLRPRAGVAVVPYVADVCNRERMARILSDHRPEIVFHAAAYKHVPLMEENPGEAIINNVFGTKTLAEVAHDSAVGRFVFISTDKAVNPTSVMGVTKQLAERYVHALSETSSTRFMVVRFGNVLASSGSVVPLFQEQIRRGGPLTLTHPDIERYFMTIPEATQLVLQAASMGKGGEIFVLDMGEPVKIINLARDLIRLSGFSQEEIEIKVTGLRPGEKLFEELYSEDEQTLATPHPGLRVAYHRLYSVSEVCETIDQLLPLVYEPEDTIRQKLIELVPEYLLPSETAPQDYAVAPAEEKLVEEGAKNRSR